VTRQWFISILVFMGVLLQPSALAAPCGCDCPGPLAEDQSRVSQGDAHDCCKTDEAGSHGIDSQDQNAPVEPDDPDSDCPCSTFCCTSSLKIPLVIGSPKNSGLVSAPFAFATDEPDDLYLDPHARGLIRPPRASAVD